MYCFCRIGVMILLVLFYVIRSGMGYGLSVLFFDSCLLSMLFVRLLR